MGVDLRDTPRSVEAIPDRDEVEAVKSLRQRFSEKYRVDLKTGCWIWIGDGAPSYGRIDLRNQGGRVRFAHHVSWELHYGPIPEGMNVLHRCDTPPCVNPKHLFLGDHQANMTDKAVKFRGAKSLTPELVSEIRSSTESVTELSSRLRVSRQTIYNVRKRSTWTHK